MEADAVAVENGFKSRHMVIRERGYDPEIVDQQISIDEFKKPEPAPAAQSQPVSNDDDEETGSDEDA
jgi:hypothetical protein